MSTRQHQNSREPSLIAPLLMGELQEAARRVRCWRRARDVARQRIQALGGPSTAEEQQLAGHLDDVDVVFEVLARITGLSLTSASQVRLEALEAPPAPPLDAA